MLTAAPCPFDREPDPLADVPEPTDEDLEMIDATKSPTPWNLSLIGRTRIASFVQSCATGRSLATRGGGRSWVFLVLLVVVAPCFVTTWAISSVSPAMLCRTTGASSRKGRRLSQWSSRA